MIDDLPQLTHLEAAIRETLRLHTVAPLTSRIAATDLVLSDGTPIPKDTRLTLMLHVTNRMKSIWGEDALEIKPERWTASETSKILPISPFKPISFLAGSRQCIGTKFATVKMKCALVVLLSHFDFETVENPWSFECQPGVMASVRDN